MLRLDDILTKVVLLASSILAVSPQQSNAATSSTVLLKKAQISIDQERYGAALSTLHTLIRSDPKNSVAYIERGNTYIRLGKSQNALRDLTIAIKMSPRSYKAYSLRAQAYEGLGQYQKQINDLTTAVNINPKDAAAYERRSYVYYQLGQLQNSIDDCITATRLDSSTACACNNAIAAYEELGLYEKAIELRTKALESDPMDALNRFYRGKDYEKLGKFALAKVDRERAIELLKPHDRLGCNPLIDLKKNSSRRTNDRIDNYLTGNTIVLPFHYDSEGHICVSAQVNSHPLQLMLDTGCSHSELWKQVMPRIAKADNVQLRSTKATGKELLYGFFTARNLKLGALTLTNVGMNVTEGLVGHRTLSGLLGGNILENFVVTIDYSKKRLILASAYKKDVPKEAIIAPITIRRHCPYSDVTLDGRSDVMALLDTGSPDNISAEALLQPLLTNNLNFHERITGPWMGLLDTETIRLKSVALGASNVAAPIVKVFPAAEAPAAAKQIILGNAFLSRFKTVTFDYPGRKIVFDPAESSGSAPSLYSEGSFYFSRNEQPQAIDAFSKSMTLDNEFAAPCLYWRAAAFMNLKQYTKALEDLTEAIKLEPTDANLFGRRAWAYEYLGQYKLQVADDTTAIHLYPNYKGAYVNRAWAYDKLGKHELAKRDRRIGNYLFLQFR